MTWEEVNDAVCAKRVALIPVAAIEQHGRHLPVDMDNLAVTTLCEAAAAQRPDLLLAAPTIHYGFNEHNMDFPGTMTVQMETFLNYCADVADSFARQGFTRILFVNGHGSNAGLLNYAARKVTNKHAGRIACAASSWWDFAREAFDVRDSPVGGFAHACELETSVYLAIRPELVQTDKIEDDFAPDRTPWIVHDMGGGSGVVHFMEYWSQRSKHGVEGAPSLATAEKGRRFIDAAVKNIIAFAEFFKAMELPPRRDLTIKA
jgi:creatinine amidohydrolase